MASLALSFRSYRSSVVPREPVAAPRGDCPGADRATRVAHQLDEEMYIVQGKQAKPEDLIGHEEMPDVRPRKSSAGAAIALLVQRTFVRAELGALDVEAAVPRERRAIATHSCGRHAVVEIDAAKDAFD